MRTLADISGRANTRLMGGWRRERRWDSSRPNWAYRSVSSCRLWPSLAIFGCELVDAVVGQGPVEGVDELGGDGVPDRTLFLA
jgi:hypothetical protein